MLNPACVYAAIPDDVELGLLPAQVQAKEGIFAEGIGDAVSRGESDDVGGSPRSPCQFDLPEILDRHAVDGQGIVAVSVAVRSGSLPAGRARIAVAEQPVLHVNTCAAEVSAIGAGVD